MSKSNTSYRALVIAGGKEQIVSGGYPLPAPGWVSAHAFLSGMAFAGYSGTVTVRVEKVTYMTSYNKIDGFRELLTSRVTDGEQQYHVSDGAYSGVPDALQTERV